ncbi:MAG: transposase [Oscillospiraceae bacterium]|nr:transposase [Oscillospiraceae bacterium]
MEQYTNELKLLAVRYYYTQAERDFERTRRHFRLETDKQTFDEWRKAYAVSAVRYYREHDCTISVVARYFGVDYSQVICWVQQYGKEIDKADRNAPFIAEIEIIKLRDELRSVREELAELKAYVRAH